MKRNRRLTTLAMGTGLLLALATVTACSSSEASDVTAPSTRAMLTIEGEPLVFCDDQCVFEGPGRNVGLGCAGNVRGATTVRATNGAILGKVAWTLDESWIVEPGGSFLYDGCCFDAEIQQQQVRYETEVLWDNVMCPAR